MTLYDITVRVPPIWTLYTFCGIVQMQNNTFETFFHELDPKFSTNCDFKVARFSSNDMLSAYLMQEIELLNDNGMRAGSFNFPTTKKTWKGSKAELQEQISMLGDSAGTFGDVPLTQLYDYIQNVFNIQLDTNLSRTFGDLKIRNAPTPFLEKLKDALLRRMEEINQYRVYILINKYPTFQSKSGSSRQIWCKITVLKQPV